MWNHPQISRCAYRYFYGTFIQNMNLSSVAVNNNSLFFSDENEETILCQIFHIKKWMRKTKLFQLMLRQSNFLPSPSLRTDMEPKKTTIHWTEFLVPTVPNNVKTIRELRWDFLRNYVHHELSISYFFVSLNSKAQKIDIVETANYYLIFSGRSKNSSDDILLLWFGDEEFKCVLFVGEKNVQIEQQISTERPYKYSVTLALAGTIFGKLLGPTHIVLHYKNFVLTRFCFMRNRMYFISQDKRLFKTC